MSELGLNYVYVSKGTNITQRVITPRGLPQQAQMGRSTEVGRVLGTSLAQVQTKVRPSLDKDRSNLDDDRQSLDKDRPQLDKGGHNLDDDRPSLDKDRPSLDQV